MHYLQLGAFTANSSTYKGFLEKVVVVKLQTFPGVIVHQVVDPHHKIGVSLEAARKKYPIERSPLYRINRHVKWPQNTFFVAVL